MAPFVAKPWRHESELAMVRDWLFPHHKAVDHYDLNSDQSDMRSRAVDRVVTWSHRMSIPHHVTATAELIASQLVHEGLYPLRDGVEVLPVGFASHFAAASTYMTAFCRFVNGFVDKDVTNGAGESSMFANAAKLGMPISFVELRHKATHGKDLPRLVELKRMNKEALEWLYETWWKINATGDPGRAIWEMDNEKNRVAEAYKVQELSRDQNESVGGVLDPPELDP